jgi:hypothetical protein
MNFRIAMVCGATMLACIGAYSPVAWAAAENRVAQPSSDSGFRIGDTLPPVKPRTPSADYEDIGWDSLLPEGWSVEKVMDDLNLNALGDNDPKAREALKKLREMWDKAPANPKLNNKRVSIAGFVVPLDGEREKTREFLLVPYFGACIHAPAPPANQVIHVVVSKTASTVKLTPAALISGTIRVVRSDTKLAVTSYEMTVDKVEPYKADESPFAI